MTNNDPSISRSRSFSHSSSTSYQTYRNPSSPTSSTSRSSNARLISNGKSNDYDERFRQPPLAVISKKAIEMGENRSSIRRNSPHNSADAETNQLFRRFDDNYQTIEQLMRALDEAGLESSDLILGIDFTKSNEWTGRNAYGGRCLHHLGGGLNPYEHVISVIRQKLDFFDDDDLIPCFGFGDVTTHDRDVFAFREDNKPCEGFEEALSRYREIVPHVRFSGPTSFAPIIDTAIEIVDQSGGRYHVLFIIADGQVTRSMLAESGQLSPQEQNTIDAIVRASAYPLSIIVVGVGDGPWDMMREFDDNIPARAFDNIQFVNFTEIMSRNIPLPQKEIEFALAAFMEIPLQYTATLQLKLLGKRRGHRKTQPLPPPSQNLRMNNDPSVSRSRSFSPNSSTSYQTPLPPHLRTNNDPSVSRSHIFNSNSSTSVQTPLPPHLRTNNDTSISGSHIFDRNSSIFYQTLLPPHLRTTNDPFVSPSQSFNRNSSTSYQTPLSSHLRTDNDPSISRSRCFSHLSSTSYQTDSNPSSPASTSRSSNERTCRLCVNKRNLAFGCGHQMCRDCGEGLRLCPFCGMEIVTRIRLHD